MKFDLDAADLKVLEMMSHTASMSEDFTDAEFRRITRLIKKINSQIPLPTSSSTRRMKVYK